MGSGITNPCICRALLKCSAYSFRALILTNHRYTVTFVDPSETELAVGRNNVASGLHCSSPSNLSHAPGVPRRIKKITAPLKVWLGLFSVAMT